MASIIQVEHELAIQLSQDIYVATSRSVVSITKLEGH